MGALVQLPTAAAKKVRQCPSRTKAADWDALLQFPLADVLKRQSLTDSAIADARMMLKADKGAVMQIALALFSVLSNNDRAKVIGRIAGLAMLNHAGTHEAIAWLNYEMADEAHRRTVQLAASMIAEGEL